MWITETKEQEGSRNVQHKGYSAGVGNTVAGRKCGTGVGLHDTRVGLHDTGVGLHDTWVWLHVTKARIY